VYKKDLIYFLKQNEKPVEERLRIVISPITNLKIERKTKNTCLLLVTSSPWVQTEGQILLMKTARSMMSFSLTRKWLTRRPRMKKESKVLVTRGKRKISQLSIKTLN
jgi:hypothetical protein